MKNYDNCWGDVERDIYTKSGKEIYLVIKRHCIKRFEERYIITDVVCDIMKNVLDFIRKAIGVDAPVFRSEEVIVYFRDFKISVAVEIFKDEIIMKTGVLNGYCIDGIMRTGRNQKIFVVEGDKVFETTQAQLAEDTKK